MKKTVCLHIIALIIVSLQCSTTEKAKSPPPVSKKRTVQISHPISGKRTIQESHPISITGIVKSSRLVNIDKSGKNPRFMLHFVVQIESYDDGGAGTVLDKEVTFVGREKNLIEQTGGRIEAGKKVLITAQIMKKSPKTIAVNTIKFL